MANYDVQTLNFIKGVLKTTPNMKDALEAQYPGAIEQIKQEEIPLEQRVAQLVAIELAKYQTTATPTQAPTPAPNIVEGNISDFKDIATQLVLASLTPKQVEWIMEFRGKGSPGFQPFLQSEEIKEVVRFGFTKLTDFLQK